MGRKQPHNSTIDVPWDHYTFNLGGNTDLQPQLRKKVEIIETEVGFCMLYPKHKRNKGQRSSTRSDDCHARGVVDSHNMYTEGRDPHATLHRDATWDSSEGSPDTVAWQKNRHTTLSPKHSRQKRGQNNHNNYGKDINRTLDFERSTQRLSQGSYSTRSFH